MKTPGLVLLLVIFTVFIVGCKSGNTPSIPLTTTETSTSAMSISQPAKKVPFEHFQTDGYYYRIEDTAAIWVINDLLQYNRPQGIEWRNQSQTEPPNPIRSFDFSKNFILFTFMGFQAVTGPTIETMQIWQSVNTIYVQAFFSRGGPTFLPTYSSPFDSLKISKDDLAQFGIITFLLLDESGKERAKATYEISK